MKHVHLIVRGICLALLLAGPARAVSAESTVASVQSTGSEPSALMHLNEPRDSTWAQPLPQPEIPDPPTDVGLSDPGALRDAEPLRFEGNNALAAAAASDDGYVIGSGTAEDPYVIRDLRFTGIRDEPAIWVREVDLPLVIENVQVIGDPVSEHAPAPAWGIRLIDCVGTVIRRSEVSRCGGMIASGREIRDIRFERNFVYSCDRAIMSGGGSHITAVGNYTRDSARYGVFLYNGTDNTIEDNYVAWAGREGTGSHGQSARLTVRNNVILHTGWTAINVEGYAHDSIAEGNLIVDTHYGIVFMGSRSICRNNRIFHATQDGVITHGRSDDVIDDMIFPDMQITDNLIVGSGQAGIHLREWSPNARLADNEIHQARYGIDVHAPESVVEGNRITRCMNGIQFRGKAGGFKALNNWIYSTRNGIGTRRMEGTGGEVRGNRLHHLINGIVIHDGRDYIIADNQMESVGQTIPIHNSRAITVTGNRLYRTGYNNVILNNSHDCRVTDNVIEAGVITAVRIQGGGSHVVSGNQIAHILSQFWGAGVLLTDDTQNNKIIDNRFDHTDLAVAFAGDASRDNTVSGNTYEHVRKRIVMQQGAEAVAEHNTLEVEPVDR